VGKIYSFILPLFLCGDFMHRLNRVVYIKCN
jgi:hypothetical protein